MRVVICGHPALRKPSLPIAEVTPEIRCLAERMTITMFENEVTGVGLAAPQVGVNIRLITLSTQDSSAPLPPAASPGERMWVPRMPLTLVNPEVLRASTPECSAVEGCLSIPEISGEVIRPETVVVRARTLEGELVEAECGGLLGRCIQHEIDHLNGILFIDRLSDEEKKQIAPLVAELERKERRYLKRNKKG